jgi:hypothetical protein
MTSILDIFADSPDHVLIPRDASIPVHFPSGTPDDLRQLFTAYNTIQIFATPQESGAPRRNSLDLDPTFHESLGKDMPPEYECPEYEGYKTAYDLGCFGAGNARLILDLSNDSPAYRLFCFYPVDPFETNPILSRSITELLTGMLNAGPDIHYIDTLI